MLPPPFDIYICFCVEVIIKLIQPDGGIQDATIWPSQVSDYLQVALINWFPNCDPKEIRHLLPGTQTSENCRSTSLSYVDQLFSPLLNPICDCHNSQFVSIYFIHL